MERYVAIKKNWEFSLLFTIAPVNPEPMMSKQIELFKMSHF